MCQATPSTISSVDVACLHFAKKFSESKFLKLVSAIRHVVPAISLVHSGKLQKSLLRNLHPRSPPPLLRRLLLHLVSQCLSHSQVMVGIALLLQFDCYLRPSEVANIKLQDFLWVSSRRLPILALPITKTGRNQSVFIREPLLLPPLLAWRSCRAPQWSPFPSYASYQKTFTHIIGSMGLQQYGFSLHSVRHGGATEDYIRSEGQDLALIMQRGRWTSEAGKIYIQQGPAAACKVQTFYSDGPSEEDLQKHIAKSLQSIFKIHN